MRVEEYREQYAKPKGRKYRNAICELDGHRFDSKAERDRYGVLKLLLASNAIANLELQPKFELVPKSSNARAITYIADFAYNENGKRIAEDVKGVETQVFRIKKKLFAQRYPEIELRIVKQP